ncbi:endonuclease domain-containing protein [Streptomyces microflavus]|uniref:AbiJ-related protein n=1 Tax=Streptomyces microflavus TaxID=1919 RepID=UPI002E111550|nr:endonuclease domain-containing protein [Streptomyces microflavus]
MGGLMDVAGLRALVDETVVQRYQMVRHEDIPALCETLGMPAPPPRIDPQTQKDNSKHTRLRLSLQALCDEELPSVGQTVLATQPVNASQRNRLQDILWQNVTCAVIPGRTRRELAAAYSLEDHARHPDSFLSLLASLWVLDDNGPGGLSGPDRTLAAEIARHVIRFQDWDAERLFDELGCFTASHYRFGQFLEGLSSPTTLPDEPAQRRFVAMANEHLRPIGAQLEEVGEEEGYPLFELVAAGQADSRRPRQVVFATRRKPDIRISSVLDGDLEVLDQAERDDDVLVYDRVVGNEGLRWRDLMDWWQAKRGINDAVQAKQALLQRMSASVPREATGQDNLGNLYYDLYGHDLDDRPALLPEVWLHWDHQTISQRRGRAQHSIRMDFLMLLPGRQRIVIEVDGSQHYTDNRGRTPSPPRYAATMASDRDLKFLGYHVYRFGHEELKDLETARPIVADFFARLLGTHRAAPQ